MSSRLRATSRATVLLAAAITTVALGACTSDDASPGSASIVSTPTASPVVAGTSVAALTPDAPTDTPTDPPFSPDPTLTPPPDGLLSVEGGDSITGQQGTWSWRNASSDAPWLPGQPIHVGVGERLTFALAELVPIESWQVARVPPASVPGNDGLVEMGDGDGGAISFAAPPPGTWSVSVHVRFGDDLGDATYYWAVTVS
jgi:hypothetical protein